MRNYNARLRSKIIALFYICTLIFFILSVRVVYVQGVENQRFKKLALSQHVDKEEIPAIRGRILDRNNIALAESIELLSVAANPREIKDKEHAAKAISESLGIDYKEVLDKLNSRLTFVWIGRKVEYENVNKLKAKKIKGVFTIKESNGKRFYTQGRLASHILGYTGIDDQGLDGVEAIYEPYLKGAPGTVEAEMDNYGRVLPHGNVKITPAVPGHNIVLSIDANIQFAAERELDKTLKEYNAKRGTVVVMEVNTGEILALANKPDFKPQFYYDFPELNLRNRAVSDMFEPGSTFKVFLAAAALDSGKITMDEKFYCGNSINIGGWEICNANDGLSSKTGKETIKEIITYSFNVGTASVSQKIGKEVFYKYINDFGFSKLTDVDLPGESEGLLLNKADWSPSSLATISFGQGISVTPVQVVAALSAIANGGKLLKPHIVKAVVDKDGNTVKEFAPKVVRRVISFKTSLELTQIMRQVVEKGTGKRAQIPGYLVAGKTGTAQMAEGGSYSSNKYIASFMGFAPAEEPRIAVLVKIEEPQGIIWGGYVAGPVFKEVAKAALWHMGIPPSMPVENESKNAKKS
ncbi:MAG: penicillin-binding transpeptidase domain-containing protein [Armatimonadota bacterium]